MYKQPVKRLPEKGASVNAIEDDGLTPLHIAARDGLTNIVKTCGGPGAYLDVRTIDGYAPLHFASQYGHVDVVKALLDMGAYANAPNNDGATPLHLAAHQRHIEVIKELLKKRAKIDARDDDGSTPLYIAAKNGHAEVVKALAEMGANIEETAHDATTPLYIAAENGHVEVVKVLLDESAAPGGHGIGTPLYAAAENGHVDVVKILLDKGATINSNSDTIFKVTPLHGAAKNGHVDVVKILLDKDANVNATDKYGATPLHEAAESGHLEVVKYLLEKGANRDVKCKDGKTALEIAKKNGHKEVITFLEAFKQPLPKNITLSPKNTVLIRMWPPIYKGEHTSYVQAIFKSLFHPLDANVGHISISIRNNKGEAYISHWPGEDPSAFKSVPGVNATLESDIESEDSFPSIQIMLHSLDTNKMIKKFKQIGDKAPWFLYGSKNTKKTGDKAYNCSSYVYEILSEGGLFDHLLTKKDSLKHTITPARVAELVKKAKEVENILYPETKEYFKENMQEYRKELLEKSQDDINAQMAVNEFLKRHPDYHLLYKNYDPDGFKILLHDVFINIENNYSKTLLAIVNSCNLYKPKDFMKQVDTLFNRGATLIAKNEKGQNALHLAIRKNNYDCVAMLLEKFPWAINSEIAYPKDNSNLKSNSVINSAHLFSTVSDKKELPPLTPLDLAIDKADESIVKLLIKKGGVTKNRSLESRKLMKVI